LQVTNACLKPLITPSKNVRNESLIELEGRTRVEPSEDLRQRDSLILQDGVKVAAHSAVLASIPYFAAKLRGDWSGNLNKKLDLHLPCQVNQNFVQAFLRCAYGALRSLRQIEATDAPFLQVGFCMVLTKLDELNRGKKSSALYRFGFSLKRCRLSVLRDLNHGLTVRASTR
jgi:hypothetical protein